MANKDDKAAGEPSKILETIATSSFNFNSIPMDGKHTKFSSPNPNTLSTFATCLDIDVTASFLTAVAVAEIADAACIGSTFNFSTAAEAPPRTRLNIRTSGSHKWNWKSKKQVMTVLCTEKSLLSDSHAGKMLNEEY
jgi:hypothetical protein